MTTMLVRVGAELSSETLVGFPHLRVQVQAAHAAIIGDVRDQEELLGLLNHLSSVGLSILEVVTVPG